MLSVSVSLLWSCSLLSIYVQAAPSITSIEVSGEAAHGSTVTMSGEGFGSKAQAAPVLFDFGGFAYENGIKNITPDTVWDKPSEMKLADDYLRHPHSVKKYRLTQTTGSKVSWPQAYGGYATPPNNDQLYVSWWYRNDIVQQEYYEARYNNKIGEFQVGEEVFIEGYPNLVVSILGDRMSETAENKIAFRIADLQGVQLDSTNMNGRLMTGSITGATLELYTSRKDGNSGYWLSAGGSTKFIRIWEDKLGKDGFRLSWTQQGVYFADNDGYSINEWTPVILNAQTWHHLEILVDLKNNIARRWVDGVELPQHDLLDARRMEGASPSVALLGFDGKQYFNVADVSDIYIDISPQRLMLGNASNWNEVTHKELQRPIEWSNNSVKFEAFLGDLKQTEPLYLYVAGANGIINTQGYPFPRVKNPAMPPASLRYKQ
jgi:hypothetical protein